MKKLLKQAILNNKKINVIDDWTTLSLSAYEIPSQVFMTRMNTVHLTLNLHVKFNYTEEMFSQANELAYKHLNYILYEDIIRDLTRLKFNLHGKSRQECIKECNDLIEKFKEL